MRHANRLLEQAIRWSLTIPSIKNLMKNLFGGNRKQAKK